MDRKTLLDLVFNQQPQLATPTISLSNDTLTIEEVENAQFYDVYINGTKQDVVGPNVAISFNESYTGYKNYLGIWDGQDKSGTLLYRSFGSNYAENQVLNSKTGYLYIEAQCTSGSSFIYTFDATVGGGVTSLGGDMDGSLAYETFKVDSDGSISLEIDYKD